MMKTPEERKEFLQNLRLAASEADDLLTSCDVSDLLDGLEVSRDFMFEASALIEQLESRLAQVERERDAAVQTVHGLCHHCKNNRSEKCRKCLFWPSRVYFVSTETYVDHWEWRGVCEGNTLDE